MFHKIDNDCRPSINFPRSLCDTHTGHHNKFDRNYSPPGLNSPCNHMIQATKPLIEKPIGIEEHGGKVYQW